VRTTSSTGNTKKCCFLARLSDRCLAAYEWISTCPF